MERVSERNAGILAQIPKFQVPKQQCLDQFDDICFKHALESDKLAELEELRYGLRSDASAAGLVVQEQIVSRDRSSISVRAKFMHTLIAITPELPCTRNHFGFGSEHCSRIIYARGSVSTISNFTDLTRNVSKRDDSCV